MLKLIWIFAFFSGCSYLFNEKGEYIPDNPVEEIGEAIIKVETGLDLDLTPGTPEK